MIKFMFHYVCFIMLGLTPFTLNATTFNIQAGEHNSTPNIVKLFNGRKMTFSAVFDESAQYKIGDETPVSDQADTNKLYGFADCNGSHLANSARFGWRWYNGKIEIRTFTHKNGTFSSEAIGIAEFNQPAEYSIEISEDNVHYIYKYNDKTVVTERGCSHRSALGYHLQPYFGGNQKAPHDISIQVDTKNNYGPLTITNVYPNPVKDGKLNFKIESFAQTNFYFDVFDMSGRKVYRSPMISIASLGESILYQEVPRSLAAGVYILRPITVDSLGNAEKAAVSFNNEDAIKLLIMH